jgi:membrane associated rhomboid family serine protease
MIGGILPAKGISWQSHLFGALSGILIAFVLRKKDLPPQHPFETEPKHEEKHFFDNETT